MAHYFCHAGQGSELWLITGYLTRFYEGSFRIWEIASEWLKASSRFLLLLLFSNRVKGGFLSHLLVISHIQKEPSENKVSKLAIPHNSNPCPALQKYYTIQPILFPLFLKITLLKSDNALIAEEYLTTFHNLALEHLEHVVT